MREIDHRNWYILSGPQRSNAALLDACSRVHIDTYRPNMQIFKKKMRRELSARQRASGAVVTKSALTPLFPGIVFVGADPNDSRLFAILDGPSGFVCRDGAPIYLDDRFIEGIRACESAQGAVLGTESLRKLFSISEEADSLDVAIEKFDASRRIKMIIDIFGRTADAWRVSQSDSSQMLALNAAS